MLQSSLRCVGKPKTKLFHALESEVGLIPLSTCNALFLTSNTFSVMVTPKVLVVLYILFCKIYQVILSDTCSAGEDSTQCYGHVWTEPATVIQMGQTISINCHSDKEFCQNANIYMEINDVRINNKLSVINKTTVQLLLHDYKNPFSTVICSIECPNKRVVICGTQFCMGYLPDKPANLTCVIHENSNNMTCTWDPGKDTKLNTTYNLSLKSLQTEENRTLFANSDSIIIPLSQLQKNQTFSVSVCAKNDLGTVHSEQLIVELANIVVPATPVITQHKTLDSPVLKTILQWEKRSAIKETSCKERYKEKKSEIWQVRDWDTGVQSNHQTEYNLNANTIYEFQVRCKLIHPGSIWSRWSESVEYMTPEAEPSSVLDVWRYLGPIYQNGSQEVTILIKPFLPNESRGRILGYRVFCENQGEMMDLCKTTETKCKVLVPPAVTIVYVTAHNSKGSSKPANITMGQQPHHYHDFPPPTDMQIIRDEEKGTSAIWGPPKSNGQTVLWYIVEWTSADFSDYLHGIMWKKVPRQNKTTFIEEDIGMKRNFSISVYAVYQDGISKSCTVQILVKTNEDGQTGINPESILLATNDDGDVGVLLGIGFGVACLVVLILTFIAQKSCRKRVSTVCSSITPAWLFEDYPKLQNSSVIKSLEERNGSVMHSSTGLFVDYADAVVTEVEEILVHKEYKALDDAKEIREAVSEKVNIPEDRLFIGNSDVTEGNGYKPQVSNKTFLGSVFSSTYGIHSQTPDTKSNTPGLPMNSLIKGYTSPMATIWPVAGTDKNTFLFEKISLVMNNSRSGQNNMVSSANEEQDTSTANQWKALLSDEDIQEQTLIPDELLSCLNVLDEDSTNVMSYFPQNTAK
ncbi:interleukin-23 receptor [Elgaria multicarinata webbii]|uniref:interleukin-23 receptor n=1 Tax=Elgaria multicarinata webbii TaxID=159646 RepID=UPI002FCD5342